MSAIHPIPRNLLPDTMAVRVPVEGEYGGEYSKVLRLVANVRFDSADALKRADYVLEDGSAGLVFVDRVNSSGAFPVPVGSLVTIRGQELSAVKVTPYETYRGIVHHWEIEVA